MSQVVMSGPQAAPGRDAKRRKQLISSVIVGSIVVHLVFGVGAAFWVVARYFSPPPATFKVQKNIQLPAEEREQKMNMAEFDALTPKPVMNEKLASIQPSDFALPDLPKVPVDQMLPLDPSAIVSEQVVSMVGAAGTGGGGGGGNGGGGFGGKGFSFLGIESKGQRIMLMFDVSTSVINAANKAKVPFTDIKAKTLDLINSLGINSRFNLMQFTRNYMLFTEEMVAATDPNKAAAQAWVKEKWTDKGTMSSGAGVVSNPSGVVGALSRVLKLDPDVIFIVSDCSFQRDDSTGKSSYGRDVNLKEVMDVLDENEKATGKEVPVNFVGFEVDREDASLVRRVSGRTGGKFKELK